MTFDTHRDTSRESLGRCIEKIKEIFICMRSFFLDLELFLKGRQHPFSHSREMNVQPIVVPVQFLGVPRQKMFFLFLDYRHQRPHVVRAIKIFVIDHEWLEHRERVHRFLRRALKFLGRLLQVGNDIANSSAAPAWSRFVHQAVGSFCKLVQHRRRC